MKKILAIGINYYPELTGIGKYTAEFCNFLASQEGFSVDVITGYPYYPKWKIFAEYKNNSFKKESINGVTVYRTPLYVPAKPSGAKRMLQDTLFLIGTFLLLNYLLIFHRKKYNYIFIPVPSFMLGLAGLYYHFFSRKTVILYHVQDLQIDAAEHLGMIKNKSLLNFLYKIERYILENVNCVSTISEGMREKILSKSNRLKDCLVFPNWINSENIFPILPKPLAAQEALMNKKIVFYSGAIGEKQGLELILETAAYFINHPDFVFIISGEGPYKEKLTLLAKEQGISNVLFYNLFPIKEFNEMLNATHIHLVIQKDEAGDLVLPSKLTNILGVGGCVIVTATPNTSLYKTIDSYKCGYIIPPMNKDALCTAIEKISSNEELNAMLSGNASNYANNFLLQEKIIKKYLVDIKLSVKGESN